MLKSLSKIKILNLIFLFIIATIVNNSNHICFADVRTDFTSPILDNIVLSSTKENYSTGSINYLKSGDYLNFDINLIEADSWNGLSYLEFSIGYQTGITKRVTDIDWTLTNINNVLYQIPNGLNGTISLTNFYLTDMPGNPIIGTIDSFTGNSNIIVDTISPEITFNDNFNGIPSVSDSINISVNDLNADTSSYKYVFSESGICSQEDYTSGITFESGVGFSFDYNNVVNTGKYLCVIAKDLAGNISYMSSSYPLDLSYDSDGDKVPDVNETVEGTDIYDISNYLDSDGDLVPNFIENLEGTDINNFADYYDNDQDYMPDYVEDFQGTDKYEQYDYQDLDGDYVCDYAEILEGTSPTDINSYLDTDLDGVPNYVEKVLDSTDDTNIFDFADEDLDGVPSYVEFVEGTDKYDEFSFLDSDSDGIPNYVESHM